MGSGAVRLHGESNAKRKSAMAVAQWMMVAAFAGLSSTISCRALESVPMVGASTHSPDPIASRRVLVIVQIREVDNRDAVIARIVHAARAYLPQVRRVFDLTPAFSMEVDARALSLLRSSPDVVRVEIDVPAEPVDRGSHDKPM